MNGEGHRLVIERALGVLRGPAAQAWRPLAGEMLSACMDADRYALPLVRGETGPWRRYYPPRPPVPDFRRTVPFARPYFPPSGFYLRRILAALRRGQGTEAARLAANFAHYLADFAEPAHYYELHMMRLVPPPARRRNSNYHVIVESVPATLPVLRHTPRLLGRSPGEARFRLEGRLAALNARSVAAIIPMLSAVYQRRLSRAERLFRPLVRDTAAILADVLHTLWSVHTGAFDARQAAALRTCDLRDVEPAAFDVEFNYGYRPLLDALTIQTRDRAERLRLRLGRGGRTTPVAVPGICPIPHALPLRGIALRSSLVYRLPAGVFTRFQALVGLHAGVSRQAACRFEVWGDGRCLRRTRWLRPADAAVPLDVAIRGCRRLELRVPTDGSTDRLAYPVWGRPRLLTA
jgi:hypothetical protein